MDNTPCSFRVKFPIKESFRRELLEEKPPVVYSFMAKHPNGRMLPVVAVWYGGESHMGHWYTQNGREFALVTRYNDTAPEPHLYTADNWLAFFVAHEEDFYDNWAADEWIAN